MVISESMARKYFGEENPVGKSILCNENQSYEITGVFKDLPENTHFRFDALFSFESLWKVLGEEETNSLMSNWGWVGTYTYVELRSPEDAVALQKKLHAYVDKRMGAELREWNEWMDFTLQPVPSIHLTSNEPDEIAQNAAGKSLIYLVAIAAFTLAMAWINYVNLTTARHLERTREVSIRKILGSSRRQLIKQFVFEAFVFNVLAIAISAVFVILVLPYFSTIVHRSLDVSHLYNINTLVVIALVLIIGTLSTGVYPALVLSGFKPINIIKGFKASTRGISLRKSLVVVQFMCSVTFIAGTVIVYKQIDFMRSSSTGMSSEGVLVVHGPTVFADSTFRHTFGTFRNELLSYSGIHGVTVSTDVPGEAVKSSNGNVRLVGEPEEKGSSYQAIMCNEDFIKTYGLTLVAGENFPDNDKDEWNTAIVNETAMRNLGFSDPEKLIGRKIYLWDSEPHVIGVVKDYHHQSLQEKIPPLILVYDKTVVQYFSIRFNTKQNIPQVIAQAKMQYERAFPGNPFQYFFMDDYFDRQYEADTQFAKVFNLFTGVAVFIACLGLFALSSYLVLQRRKEISIHKVLGASARQIAVLVTKEFLLLICLSNLLAAPFIHFAFAGWLDTFAFRIDPGWSVYLIAGTAALLIGIITVAGQAVTAVTTNVLENLRSE
jgi:putative ABC transport system permease protein